MSFAELTARQRDILVILNGIEPADPNEVKTHYEQYTDSEMGNGVLWSNIERLATHGLVERCEESYKITECGRELLEKHLSWRTRL